MLLTYSNSKSLQSNLNSFAFGFIRNLAVILI